MTAVSGRADSQVNWADAMTYRDGQVVPQRGETTGWEAALSHAGPWTEEEFELLPPGLRAELHYGRLILTPSATKRHNNAMRRLAAIFDEIDTIEDDDQVGIDVDVRMAEGAIVYRPDVFVLSRPDAERPIDAADVLLVTEIVSPGGGSERTAKMVDYAEAGIPGYLILQEEADGYAAEYHILRGGTYEVADSAAPGEVLHITEPFTCDVDLSRLNTRRRKS